MHNNISYETTQSLKPPYGMLKLKTTDWVITPRDHKMKPRRPKTHKPLHSLFQHPLVPQTKTLTLKGTYMNLQVFLSSLEYSNVESMLIFKYLKSRRHLM